MPLKRRMHPIFILSFLISTVLFLYPSGIGRNIRATVNRLQYDGSKQDIATELLVSQRLVAEDATIGTTSPVPSQSDISETKSSESSPTDINFNSAEKPETTIPHENKDEEVPNQEEPMQEGSKQEEEKEKSSTTATLSETEVSTYLKAIMHHEDQSLERLSCRPTIGARYNSLRRNDGKIHYFFALDLFNVLPLLPTLIGSIIQTMRFLGPSSCALSIVEGRSKDGTPDVLLALQAELESIGVSYYYSTSDLDPKHGDKDRMEALAILRNQALAPLIHSPTLYSHDANIVFLNDVGVCPHDILELLYQHTIQQAYMTCGMDWLGEGESFYDIFVARSLVGETFFQIAQDGEWTYSKNLFLADRTARRKYEGHNPFQVYACWNGGAVMTAAPIMEKRIAFRRNNDAEGECYMGEPTLYCKDLWRLNLGRIQVVPTVNFGYADHRLDASKLIKDQYGWVESHIDTEDEKPQVEMIEWQDHPPSLVKCMMSFNDPYWVPST
ncbi:MAG: hypothetical protein M1812_000202 [Candelaria pacifica]|nr:MAG: hypothetical protein M1812_000202 [Candelaria pacifica]